MSSVTNKAARAAGKMAGQQGLRLAPYAPPWLVLPAVLGAGHLLHRVLGSELPAAPLAVLFIAGGAAGLATLTWRYAAPRNAVIRWHSTGTVVLVAALLVMLVIFGIGRVTFWLVVGFGVIAAMSWNIRRLEVIRGEGQDARNASVLDELGLKVASKKVITATPDRATVELKLGDGGTLEDVQKKLGELGSHAGALRKGTRAVAGEREGEVTLSFSYRDVLKETIAWPGPSHPGGSIGDGVEFGLYEDGEPMVIWPAGDYARNVAPGITAIGGKSRSGKGETATVLIAELSTRRDVVIALSDTRKGDQFLDDVRAAVALYFDSDNSVKAYLRALERAGTDRNKALGAAGYKAWTPAAYTDERTPKGASGLAMPAVAAFLEESAAVLGDNATLIVELGEFLNSAGIFLFVSQQRWTHDRAPTSFRSNIANAICFGTGSPDDAPCILSDAVLEAGVDPFAWGAKYPGRCVVEGHGIDEARFPVPGKGYFGGKLARDVIAEWGPRMARLDPVTAKAFGEKVLACTPPPAVAAVTAAPEPAAAVAPQQRTAPAFDDTDVEDEEYQPTEEEEAQYVTPTMDDPELAAMAAAVDPRTTPVPGWAGEDVDLMPPAQPGEREWTKEEKEVEFGRMLEAFMADRKFELSTEELSDEWAKRVGEREAQKRWFMHELVNARIDNGQMERVGSRGRYRLLTLASVGAGHGAGHSS